MEMRNPLDGLEIGSCAFGVTGKWGKTVVRGPITRTTIQPTQWASMQGQSDYAYTKQMNQGSVGIAGSYGVSGISKLTGSLSAYFGNSSAESSKSMKVNYQILVRGGVEYVSFEDLNPALLIAALSPAAESEITRVLDAYHALNARLAAKKNIKEPKLSTVVHEPEQYPKEYALFSQWLKTVDDFKRNYGDGMVVQVAWGGIGIVSMEISNTSGEKAWKYGGEATFSYASTGASLSVGATYDGNRSAGGASVTVTCNKFSSGSPVEEQTAAWFNVVSGKSFKDLAEVKVLDKAPDMTIKAAVKNPPEFIKPSEDKGLADKIGKIKNLDDLKFYAKTSAYDKAKKNDPGLTLDKFLADADKPAVAEPVTKLVEKFQENLPGIPGAVLEDDDDDVLIMDDNLGDRALAFEDNPKPAAAFVGYTPIGIWVANWDCLFPWLATGHLNSISSTRKARPMLEFRTMLQDFLALSKLYYIADSCKLDLGFEVSLVKFDQIADSFAQASSKLQSALTEQLQILGSTPLAYQQAMKPAFSHLSAHEKSIYEVWWKNAFLRSCELGLGVMGGDTAREDERAAKDAALTMSPTIGAGNSVVDSVEVRNVDEYADRNYIRAGDRQMFCVTRGRCGFDPSAKNYSAFARFYKVLPLILPSGKIYAFGPGNGALGAWRSSRKDGDDARFDTLYNYNSGLLNTFTFTPVNHDHRFIKPINFSPNIKNKLLESVEEAGRAAGAVKLYPIPFSAAENISWLGQSFSTGIASLADLKTALEQTERDLKKFKAWSFSSDAWHADWNVSDYYGDARVPMQYIGLLQESEYNGKG
jgi:hypothetical protein